MTPFDVVLVSGAVTMIGSTLAWFLARRDKREQRHYDASAPGAPTVQEIWQRQDKIENAFRSALVILGEVADQWDGDHPPVLSKRHLNVLAEGGYLPAEFDNLLTADYPTVTKEKK